MKPTPASKPVQHTALVAISLHLPAVVIIQVGFGVAQHFPRCQRSVGLSRLPGTNAAHEAVVGHTAHNGHIELGHIAELISVVGLLGCFRGRSLPTLFLSTSKTRL